MTQKDMILDYIRQHGSISPYEAFRDLGITKLATRVSEMSKEGIEFEKRQIKGKNRYGNPVCYMRYRLK